jgi:hypothetical protein
MPTWSLPCSLVDLLAGFRPCFTTPTFRVFQAMVCGLLVQPGRRTVTGMLAGARLAGVWHHARAHRFFAAARWSADALGLRVCDLIVGWLGDRPRPSAWSWMTACSNAPAARSSGPHGTTTRPLATGRKRTAWGNNWVVVGVVVALPFVAHRQVCLPVLCRLWQPRQRGRSKLDLACELVGLVCDRYPTTRSI